ncbi:MAG: hypothetical protein OXD30_08745 [Bryobacterales bacterium]|nr:hypothetical protein [Bryobacterales bacterium]
MIQESRGHTAAMPRNRGWLAWVFVVAVAVAGGVIDEIFCHEEHATDLQCAVCQLPQQPAAETSDSLQIEFVDVAEPLETATDGEPITSGYRRGLSARGPPA